MRIHIPLFALLVTSPSYAAIQNPPVFKNIPTDDNTVVEINLDVNFKTGQLYNPKTNKLDNVKLRQYIDPNNPLPNQFVAPTIKVKQKQTLQVNLRNHLPPYKDEKGNVIIDPQNPDKSKCLAPHNTIGCINTTNLHTHGLHVSPNKSASGKTSDDIFVRLEPSIDSLKPTVQEYEYDIKDHPAGLFWYHAHLHGSTALQVTSGMAGALIIEGSQIPKYENGTFTKKGDFDVLWTAKNTNTKASSANHYEISVDDNNDLVMVFQQIQYVCGNGKEINYSVNCENQIGKVEGNVNFEGTDKKSYALLGPQGWKKSGRYTSINGDILPEIKLLNNEFYRWRMIHGGVRDTIGLKIFKLSNSNLKNQSQVKKRCEDQAKLNPSLLNYAIVAQDGITTNHIQNTSLTILQPGYRYDAILKFPEAGAYCIVDSNLQKSLEVNGNIVKDTDEDSKTIGWVNVSGKKINPEKTSLTSFLINKANIAFEHEDSDMRQRIINDLKDGNLTAFEPYDDLNNQITDNIILRQQERFKKNPDLLQLNPYQELTFTIANSKDTKTTLFGISNHKSSPDTAKAYNGSNNAHARYLALNSIGEWTLTSKSPLGEIGHPFHIHVNPFQIKEVYKINETGERSPPLTDLTKDNLVDENVRQFINLKGVWKDTLFIPSGYEVVVRTRYEDFKGDFVLHCHILDHEDQGMMQNVRICAPNDKDCQLKDFPTHHQSNDALIQHSHD